MISNTILVLSVKGINGSLDYNTNLINKLYLNNTYNRCQRISKD